MKGDIASCVLCQKVKAKNQGLAGLLKQLDIPEWK